MSDYPNQDLDLSLLNEIADGSHEFIVETISMFLEQTPTLLEEIGTHIAADNWPDAGAAAHKLKATLGFFGMLNTQALIQQIESESKAGGAADTGAKLAQAKEIVAANLPAIKQIQA